MEGVFRDLFEGTIAVGGIIVAVELVDVIIAEIGAYTITPTLQGFQQAYQLAEQLNNTQAESIVQTLEQNTLNAINQAAEAGLSVMQIIASLIIIPAITLIFAITLWMLLRLTTVTGAGM